MLLILLEVAYGLCVFYRETEVLQVLKEAMEKMEQMELMETLVLLVTKDQL